MVIHIPDSLIEEANRKKSVCHILKSVFNLFEREKHEWYIKDNDLDLFIEWGSSQGYKEFLEKYMVETIGYQQTNKNYIVRLSTDEEIVNKIHEFQNQDDREIETYLEGKRVRVYINGCIHDFIGCELVEPFLEKPLKIILENIESDKLFVETCIKLIGNIEPDQLWIEYVHGGGSDIPKVLEYIAGVQRVICIVDGDKTDPFIIPIDKQIEKQKLREICSKYGYTLHILNKKEMENYIPDNALKEHLKCSGRDCNNFDYFMLSDLQKDYFDLKRGLRKKQLETAWWKSETIIHEETAATVCIDDLNLCPLGDQTWKAWKYVQKDQELRERDGINELDDIVNKILIMI